MSPEAQARTIAVLAPEARLGVVVLANSNTVATYKVNFGDVDAAFAKAAHRFHTDLWQHRGAGQKRREHCPRPLRAEPGSEEPEDGATPTEVVLGNNQAERRWHRAGLRTAELRDKRGAGRTWSRDRRDFTLHLLGKDGPNHWISLEFGHLRYASGSGMKTNLDCNLRQVNFEKNLDLVRRIEEIAAEKRCKPSPEWNHYRVVCNNGTIKRRLKHKPQRVRRRPFVAKIAGASRGSAVRTNRAMRVATHRAPNFVFVEHEFEVPVEGGLREVR